MPNTSEININEVLILTNLGINELSRQCGVDPAILSRAMNRRRNLGPNSRIKLINYLLPRFKQPDQLSNWLKKAGWSVNDEEKKEIDRYFSSITGNDSWLLIPSYYIARQSIENQIANCLERISSSKRNDSFGLIISGLPGVGKRTLLRSVLRDFQASLTFFSDGYYWIDCHGKTIDEIRQEILFSFGTTPLLNSQSDLLTLRQIIKSKTCLFIFNDITEISIIETLAHLAPTCRYVFITSHEFLETDIVRLNMEMIRIPVFSPQESFQLINNLYPGEPSSRETKAKVFEKLGYLPLAIETLAGVSKQQALDWEELLLGFSISHIPEVEQRIHKLFARIASRLKPEELKYFLCIGVFASSQGSIELLNQTANLPIRFSQRAQSTLVSNNLIQINWKEGNRVWITHPLAREFAKATLQENPGEFFAAQERYFKYLIEKFSNEWEYPSDPTAATRAYFGFLQLQSDLFQLIADLLHKEAPEIAYDLLLGTRLGLTMFEGYKAHLKQMLVSVKQKVTERSPIGARIEKSLKILDILCHDIYRRAEAIEATIPSKKGPVEQAEVFLNLSVRTYLAGEYDVSWKWINEVKTILPQLPIEKSNWIKTRYHDMAANLFLAVGEKTKAVAEYQQLVLGEGESYKSTRNYQYFQERPLLRISLVERILEALIKKTLPGDPPDSVILEFTEPF